MVSLREIMLQWTNVVWLYKLSYYVTSRLYAQKKNSQDWYDLLPKLQEWQWQLQEPLMATGTSFCKNSEVTTASSVTPHQSMILPAVCYTSGQIWLEVTLIEFFPAFSVNTSKKAPHFPYFSLRQHNWCRSSPLKKSITCYKNKGWKVVVWMSCISKNEKELQ